ncbi:MAG: PAS domain-containing protein [Treponema sp.]|nr:PAS domain-containing protein [Treponema sp.]
MAQKVEIPTLEGENEKEFLEFAGRTFLHKTGYTSVSDFLQHQYYIKANITQNKILQKQSGLIDVASFPDAYDEFIQKSLANIVHLSQGTLISETLEAASLQKQFDEGKSFITHKFYFDQQENPLTKKITLYIKLFKQEGDLIGYFLALDEDHLYLAQSHIAHTHLSFKDIARFVPGAILVYKADPANEEILYANDEAIHLFDCNSYDEFLELTHKSFKGIVHPDDYEKTNETIWQHINHNPTQYDYVNYRIITKTGVIKEVSDIGHLVDHFDMGPLFYVFLYDQAIQLNVIRDAIMSE